MTNTYVLKRLLEHGDLTSSEMLEITGWERPRLKNAMRCLLSSKTIERKANAVNGFVYGLMDDK